MDALAVWLASQLDWQSDPVPPFGRPRRVHGLLTMALPERSVWLWREQRRVDREPPCAASTRGSRPET